MMEKSLLEADFACIDDNYKRITENIAEAALKSGRKPEDIRFMAVTKTVQPVYINHAVELGVRLIGENKVQELLSKLDYLEKDKLDMHLIGHLQSNKVRKIISTVSMIESVDSLSLAQEISRQAVNSSLNMDVLLEINIGNEESKTGFSYDEAARRAAEINELENLHVRGFMAIPPVCDTEDEARRYFAKMYRLFSDTKSEFAADAQFDTLSMGMSADYATAVLEGATLVRVGTALFGLRRY